MYRMGCLVLWCGYGLHERLIKELHKMWLGAMGLQPVPEGQPCSEVVLDQGWCLAGMAILVHVTEWSVSARQCSWNWRCNSYLEVVPLWETVQSIGARTRQSGRPGESGVAELCFWSPFLTWVYLRWGPSWVTLGEKLLSVVLLCPHRLLIAWWVRWEHGVLKRGSHCTDIEVERPRTVCHLPRHTLKMLVSIKQHFMMYFTELTIEQNNSFTFHKQEILDNLDR